MTAAALRSHVDDRGVASLTLARPDKHNALNAQVIADLSDAAARLGADGRVRVVVLRGEGASFCAGGDLEWMREQFSASRPQRMAQARALAEMLQALNTLPKPLVGAVHGNAFGGGVGLISVCDAVIATEAARFALTETRLGLIPATIGPYVAARVGPGVARRLFMTPRLWSAKDALGFGLVHTVVPEDALDAAIETEIDAYLSAAPAAIAAAKSLGHSLGPPIDSSVIAASVERLADTWETAEAREGVAAFLEKRKPWWIS